MSVHEKAPISPELEAKILEPYTYFEKHRGQDVSSKALQAFNHWLNIPKDKQEAIKSVAELLGNGAILMGDIQENSSLRQGLPVAQRIYGAPLTINAAGYAYFLAIEKLLNGFPEESRLEGVRIFTEEFLLMHRGAGLDIYWRDSFLCPTEEEYLYMIQEKSCSAIGMIIRLMQLFSEDKRDFGNLINLLGTYFHIALDYRNFKSKKGQEGKADFADDLTKGKFSFPIIHAIRNSPNDKSLINILKQRTESVEMKKYAVSRLEEAGSLAYTRKVMSELLGKIEVEVEKLGGNPFLTGLIDYLKEK